MSEPTGEWVAELEVLQGLLDALGAGDLGPVSRVPFLAAAVAAIQATGVDGSLIAQVMIATGQLKTDPLYLRLPLVLPPEKEEP